MDAGLADLLGRLHSHGVDHDIDKPDRLDRLRNLEPDSARLLALLVRVADARKVLELGTSNGYSTVWLADAVRATGGRLVSVEIDRGRSAEAADNLRRAGLDSVVELRVGDAAQALSDAVDDEWDMVFLDAERSAYTSYWPDLRRALRPGGLLAVDNVLSHAEQVADFRALVAADDTVHEAVAPTGAGVLLVVKSR
jgi:predicted O-methyltransferase YrrM